VIMKGMVLLALKIFSISLREGTNNAEINLNKDRIVDVEDLLRLIGA